MIRLIAIADDLSGAAETAAQFLPGSAHTTQDCTCHDQVRLSGEPLAAVPRVILVPDDATNLDFGDPMQPFVVLDTDNRRLIEQEAGRRLDSLLHSLVRRDADSLWVFLKVDSLLRGHLANQLRILSLHGPVIFAAALPAMARSAVGGVVHSAGVPLHRTSLWSAEGKAAPETIADALAPLATQIVDLQTVRGDPEELARILATLAARNVTALCDAETPVDLDAIIEAGLRHEANHFAGSSALGAALGRALMRRAPGPVSELSGFSRQRSVQRPRVVQADASVTTSGSAVPVLLVVGTASLQSRTQLDALAFAGVPVLFFSPAELLAGAAKPAAVLAALAIGSAAISIDASPIAPEASGRLAVALADFASPLAHGHPLVLTGGETARAVLNSTGVRWLEPLTEIEHGAVLSRTDKNGLVVTRPGSFGGADSLRTIVEQLSSYFAPGRPWRPPDRERDTP